MQFLAPPVATSQRGADTSSDNTKCKSKPSKTMGPAKDKHEAPNYHRKNKMEPSLCLRQYIKEESIAD